MEKVTDKFLRYISVETTSDESGTTHPSSLKELDLSRMLVEEMKAMGIADASVESQLAAIEKSLKKHLRAS